MSETMYWYFLLLFSDGVKYYYALFLFIFIYRLIEKKHKML